MPIDEYFEGKGEKVMASMKTTYANKGKGKAKRVFYALANKMKKKPKAHAQAKALAGALLLAFVAPLLFAQHILQRPGDVLTRPMDVQLQVASWPQGPSGVTPTPAPSTLLTDLVSAWPLSADGSDAAGSNDLTNNNGVTFVPLGPTGVVGSFVSANSEYLEGGVSGLAGATAATWSWWVKRSGALGSNQVYLSDGNFTGADGIAMIQSGGGVDPSDVTVFVQTSTADPGTGCRVDFAAGSVSEQWDHMVLVFDGSLGTDADRLKLYRNGVSKTPTQVGGSVPTTLWTSSVTPFDIGRWGPPNLRHLDGNLGRAGIWTRAFTAADALALGNAGKGKSYADLTTAEKVNLVSYWNLDETSGNRADSHGSNTLTDNNTVGSFITGPSGLVANFVAADAAALQSTVSLTADDVTIAGWVNFDGTYEDFNGYVRLATADAFGGSTTALAFYGGAAGVLYIQGVDDTILVPLVLNPTLNLTGWHYIAVVLSSAGGAGTTAIGYSVDGANKSFSGVILNPHLVGDRLQVGGIGLAGAYSDDPQASFGLWQRELSNSDIVGMFNSGRGKRYADLTAADKVGLVSYYDMNEASGTRADSHGSNDLALTAGAVGSTFNSYPANMPGTVANFVAASSQSLSRAPMADFGASYSFAVWVKGTSLVSDQAFMAFGDSWPNQMVGSLRTGSDGAGGISSLVGRGDTFAQAQNLLDLVIDGDWHLIVFTFTDSDTRQRVYVDNVEAGASAVEPLLGSHYTSGTLSFILGAFPSLNFYTGQESSALSASRVWTPTERACLWNAGAGGFYPFDSLCN